MYGWKDRLMYFLSKTFFFLLPFQGSVDQLREVWKETDGLDPQEFNPKTFFKLHGEAFCPQVVHKQPFRRRNEFN